MFYVCLIRFPAFRPGMTSQQPIKLYRLWCGNKRYTHWLPELDEIWRIALRKGLAYGDERSAGLGPLAWIEYGERPRPKARTVTLRRSHVFGAHSWLV
jgi:hypothetical protein